MQGKTNVHLIGITFIALSLVCAFWVFGIAEKLFVKKTHLDENPSSVAALEPRVEQATHVDPLSEINLPQESTASVSQVVAKMERPQPPQKSEKSRLLELESKEFKLEMRGTVIVNPSTISKDATLSVKMRPISGTNLEEFSVSDAKLILGSVAMKLNIVAVKVIDNDVVMTIISGNGGAYVVKAKIDETIMIDNNNKQNVLMQNQLFYLVNKDISYKATLSGTLIS